MLKIEMLRAGHGDCLWIEYGDPQHPRRVLIDGGATGTHKRALRPKLLGLPEKDRRFELLMVTHIDADHIALRFHDADDAIALAADSDAAP